jgi:hypothetical protein
VIAITYEQINGLELLGIFPDRLKGADLISASCG